MKTEYRGYWIQCNPKPIPDFSHDWDFWHQDYNGPGDTRHGTAASKELAEAEIDRQIEELEHVG